MVAEDRQPERLRLDYSEYLGCCQTAEAAVGNSQSKTGTNFTIEPAREVTLEVYDHPEAQVRVYIRPQTPVLMILGLLEKIANAIELDHLIRNEFANPPDQGQPEAGIGSDQNENRPNTCHRCQASLVEQSCIRDTLGTLCIKCAHELHLL